MGCLVDFASGFVGFVGILMILAGLCVLGLGVHDESLLVSLGGVATSTAGVSVFVVLHILKRRRGLTECEKRGITF